MDAHWLQGSLLPLLPHIMPQGLWVAWSLCGPSHKPPSSCARKYLHAPVMGQAAVSHSNKECRMQKIFTQKTTNNLLSRKILASYCDPCTKTFWLMVPFVKTTFGAWGHEVWKLGSHEVLSLCRSPSSDPLGYWVVLLEQQNDSWEQSTGFRGRQSMYESWLFHSLTR